MLGLDGLPPLNIDQLELLIGEAVVFFVVLLLVVVRALVHFELLFEETGAPYLFEIADLLWLQSVHFDLIELRVLSFLRKLLLMLHKIGLGLLVAVLALVRRVDIIQLLNHLVYIR